MPSSRTCASDNSQTELLHLGGNELTDSGIIAIAAALRTCAVRRLSLAGNPLSALPQSYGTADGTDP